MPAYSDFFDFKYSPKGIVYHAIDYSGYSGNVNIPDQLKLYLGFFEDTKKRRIGFQVQNGSVYRETNIANIYSVDAQIPVFNKVFSQANGHIPNFGKAIKTYDYDSGGTSIPIPTSVKDEAEKIYKDIKEILIAALVIYLLWELFGKEIMKSKRR
ncbi:hypothetical protein KQY10_11305 [Leptospira interrogans]|uniref:Uncharacterized protein n=3 Tax=Leptospira interrogans TaxID=173 RepID=M6HV02_LEPIR|nr:hypothetical protein [Leptospira interrogans]EMM83969.1 hypothetical protein LEP1GSC037_4655 [Leptospira interrogans str. 2006001854]EMM94721.1 hypothetical protein LEP1GSC158_1609 [Leptospira interrogans serovar Zanoni str. LT2156]ALO00642.1 hypothetical protein LIH_09770 [Leptospira interrogans serovar Hardjo-prajitno]EKO96143.1 hypothetical protein LEP1GSC057_1813 [Leptospira interrogans str. Brem 329]EMJ37946.1 hypothetical protein LEP1GSC079_1844 [Leptospira interrogans str. FPW1039]